MSLSHEYTRQPSQASIYTPSLSLSVFLSLSDSHSVWRIYTKLLFSVGSMCNTGSSFSCEADRRLHCKWITRCQRKRSLQAKGEEAGLRRWNDWQGHKADVAQGVITQPEVDSDQHHTHVLSYLVNHSEVKMKHRWVQSDKQRRRYAYLMGCIIDCFDSQGVLCSMCWAPKM